MTVKVYHKQYRQDYTLSRIAIIGSSGEIVINNTTSYPMHDSHFELNCIDPSTGQTKEFIYDINVVIDPISFMNVLLKDARIISIRGKNLADLYDLPGLNIIDVVLGDEFFSQEMHLIITPDFYRSGIGLRYVIGRSY